MLVNLEEILEVAEAKKIAIGAFNTPSLEALMGVIKAAEELNQPVIIMMAEVHEDLMPLDVIGPIMVDMAEKSSVPVCVHLDHGVSLSYLKRALDMGFTSIMYDGSVLPYAENVANTKIAVSMAAIYGASVEGEIGAMSRNELGEEITTTESMYTDPEIAQKFVEETGIDALACSFGTVHGIYATEPKLDFERVKKIKEMIDCPIVMHGGSGVSHEDYKKVIDCGVRKINYYTYMSKAGGTAVAENKDKLVYFHDIVLTGIDAMYKDVLSAMKVFTNSEE